jgi:uncharacterized membrane protein YphA (DoxX/SURF4 family)
MAARRKRARRKRGGGAPGGSLLAPKIGLTALRLFTGAVFLAVAHWKLVRPDLPLGETLRVFAERDYIPLVQHGVANPPEILGWRMQWFSTVLESVFLPGNAPYVFGTVFLLFEVLIGIGLVLGACVRLLAGIGAILMLLSGLAKGMPFLTIQGAGSNWMLMMMLLVLAATAAGRIWGLDARLHQRLPRWIS